MSDCKTLPRTLDSLADLATWIEEFANRHSLDGSTSYALQLAAEELFTNFVRHNRSTYPTVDVTLERRDSELTLVLLDQEVEQFDQASLPRVDTTQPLDQRQPGGLGVHLVQSCFDDLRYDYCDRVLTVTATRRVGPGVPNPTE